MRRRETVCGCGARHATHGWGACGRIQIPTHAVSGRPSNALEARKRGWFLKRLEESNEPPPR